MQMHPRHRCPQSSTWAGSRTQLVRLRAKTLADAVTQLYAAFIAVDALLGFELSAEDRNREATMIRRALLSTIPVVAEAAALDLAAIGADYIPDFAAREFPVEA
jgi:NAD(P)H-hydrate repair Nnr-like enzyme with NAD(P)H-hydrate epimerase domain